MNYYYLVEIKCYNCKEKQSILIAAYSYKDVLDKIISDYVNDIDIENIKISLLCNIYKELTEEMAASLKKFAEIE